MAGRYAEKSCNLHDSHDIQLSWPVPLTDWGSDSEPPRRSAVHRGTVLRRQTERDGEDLLRFVALTRAIGDGSNLVLNVIAIPVDTGGDVRRVFAINLQHMQAPNGIATPGCTTRPGATEPMVFHGIRSPRGAGGRRVSDQAGVSNRDVGDVRSGKIDDVIANQNELIRNRLQLRICTAVQEHRPKHRLASGGQAPG